MSGNTASTFAVDDRKVANGPENTGIVHLTFYEDGKVGNGTGFIVGNHQIATAAHCVYNCEDGKWRFPSVCTYGTDGKLTETYLTAVELHIPFDYYMSEKEFDPPHDYALITVKEDLSSYTKFSVATSYNVGKNDFANIPLYVTGCPGVVDHKYNANELLYSTEGRMLNSYSNNKEVLYYDIYTSKGQSGSPVYTITDRKVDNETTRVYTALGVMSSSYDGTDENLPDLEPLSWGARFTKKHLQFYLNNSNMSWE